MDCISPMQNKRRHSGELEQWHNQPKRQCNGLGGCGQLEYSVVVDTPMDTWDAPNHSSQNGHSANVPVMQVLNAPGRAAGQHCSRCMAGEPGHINHIMRY
ncbi:uncharacterized protein si:ch211-221j21.3 isoform X1 [Danio rerio]|uniref:Si:ch211-221j21.3 n=2 Tax=Danio rerio TaxID=7955 RepID=A0A0R4IAQ4_DANRE|nr:uncharacterized protein si:ch211-221j21.3 isoform X1 [Danio rerio]|eukprot:XP_706415.1 uncharacterized protein si:ch211-221j21.3 isoform X1 [Danio rerio]